uniref:Uncharacterized protein n=1 Tax=Trichogramma kaykai TaxID=54128 RepID=A0ABD2WCI7_9HYME
MKDHYSDLLPDQFIEFVIRTGYKDEPDINEDSKPLLRCTTPIHYVLADDNAEKVYHVRDLFEIYHRFDVNYIDDDCITHFHAACMSGCEDIVKKFLELGQNPNLLVQKTGDSPLHLALARSKINVAESLLRGGADPNLANDKGYTPLHIICRRNADDDLANRFFTINVEIQQTVYVDALDKSSQTPLNYALTNGHKAITESLLRKGADPNFVNVDGFTPLHYVCWRNYYDDDVELANPNLAEEKGFTLLHIICKRDHDDDVIEMFFKTIQQTIQVDAPDKLGRTPLQWAVTSLLPGVINVLLDHGADLSSFVFPTLNHFDESLKLELVEKSDDLKLRLASGAVAVVECLEKRMYEPNRSDILTIMTIFAKCRLFEK